MIVVGVDPDTKATGIAVVMSCDDGSLEIETWIARAEGRLAEDRAVGMAESLSTILPRIVQVAHALVVERQAIRPSDPRPNDILNLAAVAGMVIGITAVTMPEVEILTPLPVQWKGSVPKAIHQKRVLKKAGLTLSSSEFRGILSSHRTHAVDALGLALWGLEKMKR